MAWRVVNEFSQSVVMHLAMVPAEAGCVVVLLAAGGAMEHLHHVGILVWIIIIIIIVDSIPSAICESRFGRKGG